MGTCWKLPKVQYYEKFQKIMKVLSQINLVNFLSKLFLTILQSLMQIKRIVSADTLTKPNRENADKEFLDLSVLEELFWSTRFTKMTTVNAKS